MSQVVEGSPCDKNRLMELTAEIVCAFVSNNSVPISDFPDLILAVQTGLLAASKPPAPASDPVSKATPAQIKRSITDDGLISFEDGRAYKILKRHLKGCGLTPAAYRTKHGLPSNYPMTAPGYSRHRSKLARKIGLGRGRQGLTEGGQP